MPVDGNFPSCTGKGQSGDKLPNPPKERSKKKLVRIGSRYISRDTHTERRFNVGVELGKAPSGVRFKTLNEIVVDKQHTYKAVNKKLPTYPGEPPDAETPDPEEEELEFEDMFHNEWKLILFFSTPRVEKK